MGMGALADLPSLEEMLQLGGANSVAARCHFGIYMQK